MEQNTSIYSALAKAQANFRPVVKNCVNPAFRNRYADLQAVLDAVRPALNEQGIFLQQNVSSEGNSVTVETILGHESGTISSGKLTMPAVAIKGQLNAQCFGSAETYARRYSLCAFLGVSAEDDDDGAGASSQQAPRQEDVLTDADVAQAKNAAGQGRDAFTAWGKEFKAKRPGAYAEFERLGWKAKLWELAKASTPEGA